MSLLCPSSSNVLTAGVFHFPPFTSINNLDDDNDDIGISGGIDVKLISTIAQSLNCKVNFVQPSDGKMWGNVFSNGSGNGLIGDILSGKVDLGAAEYFNKPFRNEFLDPSELYAFDYFCFVLKR